MIRWAAGFIVNVHTKKTVHVERYLKLPGDIKQRPQITKGKFEEIAKKFKDSANNYGNSSTNKNLPDGKPKPVKV